LRTRTTSRVEKGHRARSRTRGRPSRPLSLPATHPAGTTDHVDEDHSPRTIVGHIRPLRCRG
jgi:hypothetical protein